MKYSWEFKLECCSKYKNGEHIDIQGSPGFHHGFMKRVRDWVAAYDDLGIDGLKHSPANKNWTPEQRFELVAKVLYKLDKEKEPNMEEVLSFANIAAKECCLYPGAI